MSRVYSEPADVFDPLICGISRDEDHEEAGHALDRELRKRGIDPALVVTDDAQAYLKTLSVIYASLVRCRLSMSEQGDSYHVRVVDLKEQWIDGLNALKYEVVLGQLEEPRTVYSLLGSVAVRRG